jgi:hypothetical protein
MMSHQMSSSQGERRGRRIGRRAGRGVAAVLVALAAVVALSSAARPASAELAQAWMVDAAANSEGYQGTYWLTDLSLHNPHEYDLPVVIQALPSSRVNYQVPTLTLTLYPWETFNLWDAYGPDALDVEGTGAILVYADLDAGLSCSPASSCAFLVTSRTYTPEPLPGQGEYGQTIPGLAVDQGVDWSTFGYLAGVLNDGQWFRTNVGVASWTGEWTSVRIDIQDADGTILATQDLSIPPYGHIQRRLSTAVSGGSLVFYLTDGPDGALVFPYASVVNELTGDPSFFPASPSGIGVTLAKRIEAARGPAAVSSSPERGAAGAGPRSVPAAEGVARPVDRLRVETARPGRELAQ